MLGLVGGLGFDDSLFGGDLVFGGFLFCLLVCEFLGKGVMLFFHLGYVVVVECNSFGLFIAEIALRFAEVGLKLVDQVDDLLDDGLVRKVVLGAGELDQSLDHWGVCASHLEVREFLLNGLEGLAGGLKEYGTTGGGVV